MSNSNKPERLSANGQEKLFIFVIWLFHISGIIGISLGHKEWFVSNTPITLLVTFVLLIWKRNIFKDQRLLVATISAMAFGFVSEGLGVNYNLIFGTYAYGANLGLKVWGVPLTIAVNWAILTICTATLVNKLVSSRWLAAVLGALSMVLLDFILEPVAPKFDFWEFEGGMPGPQNFVGWFFVALLAHGVYQWVQPKSSASARLEVHTLAAIVTFFGFFILFPA
jgi:putative membrane protein